LIDAILDRPSELHAAELTGDGCGSVLKVNDPTTSSTQELRLNFKTGLNNRPSGHIWQSIKFCLELFQAQVSHILHVLQLSGAIVAYPFVELHFGNAFFYDERRRLCLEEMCREMCSLGRPLSLTDFAIARSIALSEHGVDHRLSTS
jgi:hypothetical protein